MTQDICIVQITDTHLLATENDQFIGIRPEQHFHDILQLIQQQHSQIDYIIHTGDVAQVATAEVYARYMQQMQSLNIPFNHTLGNHDKAEFFPFIGHHNGELCVLDFEHWQIILLNSAISGRVDGEISIQQLDALQQHLSQTSKFTLIALHHHPLLMQSEWIDQHCLKNSTALLHILEQYSQVKICLFGHVHQHFAQQWQHIHFFATPASAVQFKPKSKDFSLDDTAPAYRSLILKANGEFDTQVYYLEHFQKINENCEGY